MVVGDRQSLDRLEGSWAWSACARVRFATPRTAAFTRDPLLLAARCAPASGRQSWRDVCAMFVLMDLVLWSSPL